MRDGRGELDEDRGAFAVPDRDLLGRDDGELLERERVLRVRDGADQVCKSEGLGRTTTRQYHPDWACPQRAAATLRDEKSKRTKDLVLVNLVSGPVVPLQAGIAPRELEGVRFVLELVTESVPGEVIVGGEVEVGDADAAGAARRRVDRRIRVVGRGVDHLVQVCGHE